MTRNAPCPRDGNVNIRSAAFSSNREITAHHVKCLHSYLVDLHPVTISVRQVEASAERFSLHHKFCLAGRVNILGIGTNMVSDPKNSIYSTIIKATKLRRPS